MCKYRFSREKRIEVMEDESYELFFDGLKQTYGGALQNLIFLVNRIASACVLIGMRDDPLIACQIMLLWNVGKLGYFMAVRPYKDRLMNNTEIWNDITSVITFYLLMSLMAVDR